MLTEKLLYWKKSKPLAVSASATVARLPSLNGYIDMFRTNAFTLGTTFCQAEHEKSCRYGELLSAGSAWILVPNQLQALCNKRLAHVPTCATRLEVSLVAFQEHWKSCVCGQLLSSTGRAMNSAYHADNQDTCCTLLTRRDVLPFVAHTGFWSFASRLRVARLPL
jgi:hypothetical protein